MAADILELEIGVTGEDLQNQIPDIARVETYLQKHYEFRFNTIKHMVEFRPLNTPTDFKYITDYDVNSIVRDMKHNFIKGASSKSLMDLLISKFTTRCHPVQEYLKSLPKWDGQDYIKALADNVEVTNKEHWQLYFKKWLVACVANAVVLTGCQNQSCMVLVGGQNAGKTTFLNSLCPDELSAYITQSSAALKDKDTLIRLAEYWFINIDDQLISINKKDSDALKALITMPEVKLRRPYGKVEEYSPRIANFMGSINEREYLTDATGSRRFLSFEVISINWVGSQAIPRQGIWQQAYALFNDGFNFRFSKEDVEELNAHNEAFNIVSKEFELFNRYFYKVTAENETAENNLPRTVKWLSLTDILTHITSLTRENHLSSRGMGMALKRMGIEKQQRTIQGTKERVYLYPVYTKEGEEIGLNQTEDKPPF